MGRGEKWSANTTGVIAGKRGEGVRKQSSAWPIHSRDMEIRNSAVFVGQ